MKLEKLKDFEALVKLCRKLGVEAMEIGDVKFNLGPEPRSKSKPKVNVSSDFPEADIQIPQYNPIASDKVSEFVEDTITTDELTPEQLLFYSAKGEMNEEQQDQ